MKLLKTLLPLMLIVLLAFGLTACGDDTGKTLESVTVNLPASMTCEKGEAPDFKDVTLTATYSDGSTETIENASLTFSDVDTSERGEKTVTVTYNGKSAEFTLTVIDSALATILDSLEVDAVSVPACPSGSAPDFTALIVKAVFADEHKETLTDGYEIAPVDTSVPGDKTVTVTYQGKEATFTLTVFDSTLAITLESIVVNAESVPVCLAGRTPDYTALIVEAVFADKHKETLTEGFEISPVDTTTDGDKTVTVTYQEKQATFTLKVEYPSYLVTSLLLPKFIRDYATATQKINEGEGTYKTAVTYRVGDDNVFRFLPTVIALDEDNDYAPFNPTDARLGAIISRWDGEKFVDLSGTNLTDAVSFDASKGEYDFTEAAVGSRFKITVYAEDDEECTVSHEVTVVDGWNVYSAIDMAYMANGVEGYDGFNEKTVWDAFKTAHDIPTDVSVNGIVLHTHLAITKADLPEGFFVSETLASDPSEIGYLLDYAFPYRHDLAAGETFGFWGNGFTIDVTALPSVNPVGTWGYGSDYSNAALFCFNTKTRTAAEATVTMQDVTVIGNAMRTNDKDQLVPDLGGFIGFEFSNVNATLSNTIVTRSFIGLMPNYASNFVADGVRVYDSLQDALFQFSDKTSAFGTFVDLRNCEFKRAGGPLMIVQHARADQEGAEKWIPTMTSDANCVFENWVNGGEAWFVNNGASAQAAQIRLLVSGLADYAVQYNGALSAYGKSEYCFTTKSGIKAENETTYLNILNLLMSNGVGVDDASVSAQGKYTVADDLVVANTQHDATNPVYVLRQILVQTAGEAAGNMIPIFMTSAGDLLYFNPSDTTDSASGSFFYVEDVNPESFKATLLSEYITSQVTAAVMGGTPDTSLFTEGDYITVYTSGLCIVMSYQ